MPTRGRHPTEETLLLSKDTDRDLIGLFEEAKSRASERLVESPDFSRDFSEKDQQFLALIGIASQADAVKPL